MEELVDQTVELFCGAEKRFSQIAGALGYSTFTVDPCPEVQPDLTGAVSSLLAASIPAKPLLVWAAPPFDPVFKTPNLWESDGSLEPRTDEAKVAIDVIRNTISLLTALQPKWWFIEHPSSLVRKMPLFAGFNRGYPTRNRHTIEHRGFGGTNDAKTDIWTNAFWWLPDALDSNEVRNAPNFSTERVPPFVYAQVLEQLDNYTRSQTN